MDRWISKHRTVLTVSFVCHFDSYSLEPGGAGGGEPPPSFLLPQSEEFEPRVSELELDPPNWRELVPHDTLFRLKKSEVKRQEVINGM